MTHHIYKCRYVPVIHIDTVARKYESKLIDQTLPCRFNTKYIKNLNIIIWDRLFRIDMSLMKNTPKRCAISLNHPVFIVN